eukprot:7414404-Pyramimonas_sp.AAC.1
MGSARMSKASSPNRAQAVTQNDNQENIWVGVRVRPQNKKEVSRGESTTVRILSEQVLELVEISRLFPTDHKNAHLSSKLAGSGRSSPMPGKSRLAGSERSSPKLSPASKADSADGVSNTGSRFTYNRVFDESAGNKDVYDSAARQIVLSGMEGKNGTVFAYGQTGSGKTHTMRAMLEEASREMF